MRKNLLSKLKTRVRLPSGVTVIHVVKKKSGKPYCSICGGPLHGVNPLGRTRSQRRVERIYGGVLCGRCVRRLIVEEVLLSFG